MRNNDITNNDILKALEESRLHWIKDNVNITQDNFDDKFRSGTLDIYTDNCALCKLFDGVACISNLHCKACPLYDGSCTCRVEWKNIYEYIISISRYEYHSKHMFTVLSQRMVDRIEKEIENIKKVIRKDVTDYTVSKHKPIAKPIKTIDLTIWYAYWSDSIEDNDMFINRKMFVGEWLPDIKKIIDNTLGSYALAIKIECNKPIGISTNNSIYIWKNRIGDSPHGKINGCGFPISTFPDFNTYGNDDYTSYNGWYVDGHYLTDKTFNNVVYAYIEKHKKRDVSNKLNDKDKYITIITEYQNHKISAEYTLDHVNVEQIILNTMIINRCDAIRIRCNKNFTRINHILSTTYDYNDIYVWNRYTANSLPIGKMVKKFEGLSWCVAWDTAQEDILNTNRTNSSDKICVELSMEQLVQLKGLVSVNITQCEDIYDCLIEAIDSSNKS